MLCMIKGKKLMVDKDLGDHARERRSRPSPHPPVHPTFIGNHVTSTHYEKTGKLFNVNKITGYVEMSDKCINK